MAESPDTPDVSQDQEAAESIYNGVRHTVAMAITYDKDAAPDGWSDLDFRSPHQDVELALQEYLQETFGEEIEIQHENGLIFVDDPDLPDGDLRRYYRPQA